MIARWNVSLSDALMVIGAAQRQAAALDLAVAVAVVDASGGVVAVQAMDGVQPAGPEVAVAKARAAALFRRPTSAFEDIAARGTPAVLLLPSAVPHALAVTGGVPIPGPDSALPVGAVGVSGGSGAQDADIARAGAAAVPGLPAGREHARAE